MSSPHGERLVADQRAQAVLLGRHEAVEVLEQVLDFPLAGSGDLPHRLRERLRAGGVQCRNSTPVELAEQLESDHALAGAGAASDDDDLLAIGVLRLLHRVKHQAVRDLLLVEKDELCAFAHLFSSHGHELLRRHLGTRTEFVRGLGPRMPGAQPRTEVVEKGAAAFLGEEQSVAVTLDLAQPGHAELGGVVQICHSGHPVPVFSHRAIEIDEVFAVAAHLLDGVEDRLGIRVYMAQGGVVLVRKRLTPLLQLHHDVRRFARDRMHSCQHDVRTLTVQRERVLQHDLHVAQAGVVECGGQDGDAALPGTHLRGAGPIAVHVDELVGEVQEQRTVECHDGDRFRGRAEQQGLPPGSTKRLVRVGACPSRLHRGGAEARRAALTMRSRVPGSTDSRTGGHSGSSGCRARSPLPTSGYGVNYLCPPDSARSASVASASSRRMRPVP
ncbi:hypothetical protein SAURM35S_08318 [Streptomyces aurantiogriseus]